MARRILPFLSTILSPINASARKVDSLFGQSGRENKKQRAAAGSYSLTTPAAAVSIWKAAEMSALV